MVMHMRKYMHAGKDRYGTEGKWTEINRYTGECLRLHHPISVLSRKIIKQKVRRRTMVLSMGERQSLKFRGAPMNNLMLRTTILTELENITCAEE